MNLNGKVDPVLSSDTKLTLTLTAVCALLGAVVAAAFSEGARRERIEARFLSSEARQERIEKAILSLPACDCRHFNVRVPQEPDR